MRLFGFDTVAQALRGEFTRCIARQAQRFGNRRAQEGIAERIEH